MPKRAHFRLELRHRALEPFIPSKAFLKRSVVQAKSLKNEQPYMDKWSELRTVYQVAKLGTVSAAAEVLDMHRATVNRHIETVEDSIGGRIFIRHARGYTLTELGHEVLRVAETTTQMLDNLTSKFNGNNALVEGEILITLVPPLVQMVVGKVAIFRAHHPNCRVNIIATDEIVKLEHGEAHVALRAGKKPDHPDYVVRHFQNLRFHLYGHRRYFKRHGRVSCHSDLNEHKFVLPKKNSIPFPFWDWAAKHVEQHQIAVISNTFEFDFQAIHQGIGLGFIPEAHAAHDTDFSVVIEGGDDWCIPIWLVTHVDVHRTEKIQSFLQALTSQDRK